MAFVAYDTPLKFVSPVHGGESMVWCVKEGTG